MPAEVFTEKVLSREKLTENRSLCSASHLPGFNPFALGLEQAPRGPKQLAPKHRETTILRTGLMAKCRGPLKGRDTGSKIGKLAEGRGSQAGY